MLIVFFGGKFGERTNKSKVMQLKTPHELFNILTDSANHIQTLRICTDDVLEVVFKQTDANDMANPTTVYTVILGWTCRLICIL